MIFLEILLFTSKLILILSESNQNHNVKDFFVCNCVCAHTCAFSGNPCLAEKGFNICCYGDKIM